MARSEDAGVGHAAGHRAPGGSCGAKAVAPGEAGRATQTRVCRSSHPVRVWEQELLRLVREFGVDNPFRPGWSLRLGPLRLRSVPWYWYVLRERLLEASARRRPAPPSPAHHDHYCEKCDHQWIHEGHTCAYPWAFPCGAMGHNGVGTGRDQLDSWLIVIRGDRTELGRQLGESFKADPRVSVVVDRRRTHRRALSTSGGVLTVERRRLRDRRMPQTSKDGSIWQTLGFRVLQAR